VREDVAFTPAERDLAMMWFGTASPFCLFSESYIALGQI
jgi:hypothetical protein